ncbi:MAG: sugar phosphate isomerase/epimerase [Flammeovirgaceae bacterium]|nr:sugar phosphate isomerase/epimerase [Flammeovirgaceae bacterium]
MKNSKRAFVKSLAIIPAIPFTSNMKFKEKPKNFAHLFKLSLNLYSFNKPLREGTMDLFDVLDFCAKHNFGGIDPTGYYFPNYPEVPTDDYIYKFKRKAFLLGLDITGTGVRNDFVNPNAEKRKEDIELIKKWIEVSAKLGCPHVRIFSGNHTHEGYSRDQVFERMAEDIQTCCNYAEQFGVMLSIQNHNDFLKTADDMDQVFERVGSPWLGQNLDIGSYREKDPYKEVEQNIKHAITWQIKENVWINGKETPTDFVKLFKIIKKAGYRGYLPLETLGEGDPFQKIEKLLVKVRAALEEV